MFMLMLFFRLLVFSNIDILLSHNIGPFYREFNPILVLFDITLSDFIVIASYFGNFSLSFFVDILYFINTYIIKEFYGWVTRRVIRIIAIAYSSCRKSVEKKN